MSPSPPRLSVIIPVHNGGANLHRCLEALASSTRPPDEVVVVDDASTDASGKLARGLGARVLRIGGSPRGPAFARNRGAETTEADILVFLDADVAVHADTLSRVEQHLAEHPDIAAVFGSYDSEPPARGLASRYKNLLHHYVHQRGRREATTFWAGCAAIRREVFASLGGFDENYTRPSVEDIELGVRLRRAGHRVWLCSDVQATHLKQWTFASLLRSDILDRAIPWTRLIARDAQVPADLNLNVKGRLSAVATWIGLALLVLGLWIPWAWVGTLLAVVTVGLLNADLYRFLARQGGMVFAAGAAGLHVLYLTYSSVVFALIIGAAWLARHGLALVLLGTLLKGLTWSIVIPPWHGPDENRHFLYGQILERFRTVQIEPNSWWPEEARRLTRLAQFSARWHPDVALDLTDRTSIAKDIRLLDDPTIKHTYRYDDSRSFRSAQRFLVFHPPLYYAVVAVVQGMLEGSSILVRTLANRWLSVVLGAVTVALAHKAGHELWPDRPGWPLLLATLVSFQPMNTFCTAIINNQALEIALFSAGLMVSFCVIRQGMTWRRGVALGLVVGLGLLTKISFLSVLPLVGLLFVFEAVRLRWRSARPWRALWPWALVALIPVMLSGWWYKAAVLSGGDTLVTPLATIAEKRSIHLLTYLLHYGWLTVNNPVLHSYWGVFGWLDAPLPNSLLVLLTWATVIVMWTAGWWLVRQVTPRSSSAKAAQAFAVFFSGCATLSIVAFYTYLDFRMARDLGGQFFIQGRYYLPAIVGQMVWLTIGLTWPAPDRLRRVWAWLVGVGVVALNLYAMLGVVVPRYYGIGDLVTLLERATVLQPLGPTALLVMLTAFMAVTAALLAALWRALPRGGEPDDERPADAT